MIRKQQGKKPSGLGTEQEQEHSGHEEEKEDGPVGPEEEGPAEGY